MRCVRENKIATDIFDIDFGENPAVQSKNGWRMKMGASYKIARVVREEFLKRWREKKRKKRKDICSICGFDSGKPIGKAMGNINKGQWGNVKLNDNGMRAIRCVKSHITA